MRPWVLSVAAAVAFASLAPSASAQSLAETYGWNTGGAVRFPDGRVEIFGARDDVEPRVLCVKDGIARPLSTCPGAVVQGTFRFD